MKRGWIFKCVEQKKKKKEVRETLSLFVWSDAACSIRNENPSSFIWNTITIYSTKSHSHDNSNISYFKFLCFVEGIEGLSFAT